MLSSISIYSMGICKWPTSVIKEGEIILHNFLWSGEPDSKKACIVSWDKVLEGAIEDIRAHSGWVIGDGANIDLWRDNWCSPISLKNWINNDCISWNDLHAKAGDSMSPYLKDLWTGAVWGGSNLIWQDHNKCHFEDQVYTLANDKRKWLKQIHDSAVLSTGLMFNNHSDLGILHHLGVAVQSSKNPLVKSFFWVLPRIGEIKINTNGAAKGNPGKGGIGCIFHDSNGNVLGTLSKSLGLVTNYMEECEAIIHGVEYAASFEGVFKNLVDVEPLIIDVTTYAQDLGRNYRVGENSVDMAHENRSKLETGEKFIGGGGEGGTTEVDLDVDGECYGDAEETNKNFSLHQMYGISDDIRLKEYLGEMTDQEFHMEGILVHQEQIKKGLKLDVMRKELEYAHYFYRECFCELVRDSVGRERLVGLIAEVEIEFEDLRTSE
ncbi:hypothetical protein GIB67_041204 [Kingdonia uniflora]|uniref:RNase H type-1 domain-containing protein n=1 Tax=Kingdonia uniflora TaxID=39325 RepID=A0A7J7N9Y2_9MAGN|nr:hypothetical protein GIB67_041204 [Kingdonia uniflora]